VSRYLPIYLNDHLSGATLGVELARRARNENEGGELGSFLDGLLREIDEDRNTLIEVMQALRIPQSRPKVAMGWLSEKAGRLKLNGQLTGYSPLSRLLELEGLSAGINAKRGLWRSLAQVKDLDMRLTRFDFDALEARAVRQLDELEEHRAAAARNALR
jgi:hypothetical protein